MSFVDSVMLFNGNLMSFIENKIFEREKYSILNRQVHHVSSKLYLALHILNQIFNF